MQQTTRDVTFNFRKPSDAAVKEAIANGAPAPIKKNAVTIPIRVMSLADILEVLQNPDSSESVSNQKDLIAEAVNSIIIAAVKNQIDEQSAHEQVNIESIDFARTMWDALANTSKAERTGNGVPKEVWEAFAKDFAEIMPAATGRSSKGIENVSKVLLNKLQTAKGNKPVLELVRSLLDIWITKTERADEFAAAYEFLMQKSDAMLAADDTTLVANFQ